MRPSSGALPVVEGSARRRPHWASLADPLHLLVVVSLIGPLLLLFYAAWAQHRSIVQQAGERTERALDVIEEHALKAVQTVERTIAEVNEVLRDRSDAQIRADEDRLHRRLQETQKALPQVQAIWAFDRTGRPLVSSTLLPVPQNLDNTDRDYFAAHMERDGGTHLGELITGKIGGARVFVISRRRSSPDGAFAGIVAVAVLPGHFQAFYARISRGIADSFGLIRADGAFLARHPWQPSDPVRLGPESVFLPAIKERPDSGRFTAVSQIDGVERRIGYRKLPGYPLYVQVGIETAAIWRELRTSVAEHLVFGIPATLLLIWLSFDALRRSRRFRAEVRRREAAETALKQAQRLEALGQLTGGVAHDTCSWW